MMRKSDGTFWLVLLAATSLVAAEPVFVDPQPGVLLLRNGSIIEGKIVRSGDRYDVTGKGSELRVRVSEVEFTGNNFEECYAFRRRGIDSTKVQDHLDLADWCMRNALYDAAGRELLDAMACDPKHPKLGLLERRLKMAMEVPALATTPSTSNVKLATTEELDRLVRGMPAGSVETFANTIQPLLLNQCSTAGCHGPTASNKLRLMRIASNRTQSRRATQRNLHAVLTTLDMERPDQSPLLTMPIKAHGTTLSAIFTTRQAVQYRQLVNWAYFVASKQEPIKPSDNNAGGDWPVAENSSATPNVLSTPPNKKSAMTARNMARNGVRQASATTSGLKPVEQVPFFEVQPTMGVEPMIDATDAEKSGVQKEAAEEGLQAAALELSADELKAIANDKNLSRRLQPGISSLRSQPQRGELPKEAAAKDPFDPDEFNRKYAGEQ